MLPCLACITLVSLIAFGPVYGQKITHINKEIYSPKMTDVLIGTSMVGNVPIQLPNKEIRVYAGIFDLYGQINYASILYSTDQLKSSKNVTMRLINGAPFNGTYLGIIPAQRDDTTVTLKLFFKDDLNYSSSMTFGPFVVGGIPFISIGHTRTVYALVADTNVKNATLFYRTGLDSKFVSVPMKKAQSYPPSYPYAIDIDSLLHYDRNFTIYSGPIPNFPPSTHVQFYVRSNEFNGNEAYSLLEGHVVKTNLPLTKNVVRLVINYTNINALNLTAEANIRVDGTINYASFDYYTGQQAAIYVSTGKHMTIIPLSVYEGPGYVSIYDKISRARLSLSGDPTTFH